MAKKINIIVLFFLLYPLLLLAKKDNSEAVYYIHTITIEGTRRTKDGVILRELPFKIPGKISQKELQYYHQRLMNLNLFKKVDFTLSGDTLKILVDEGLSFYVIPSFHVIERDWNKIIYGLMYVDFNFAGDKIYLYGYGWLGYNRGISFAFLDDWFTSKKLILGLNFNLGRFLNKNTDYNEIHKRYSIQFGKRFYKDYYLTFGFGGRFISIPEEERILLGLKKTTFYYNLFLLQFIADRRNYFVFPTSGYLFKLIYSSENKKFLSFDYKHLQIDIREYIPIFKNISLSFKQFFHGASHNLPFYDGVYFGYDERIRGHFNLVLSTRNIAEALAEIRFPIIKRKYYNLPSPMRSLQNWFKNLEFGISGGLFMDQGLYSDYWKSLSLQKRFYGYGASLYFHLPYNNIMRFDIAFNENGKYEFIIENMVSF